MLLLGIPSADGERRVLVEHCPRVVIERTEFGTGTLSDRHTLLDRLGDSEIASPT
jgi:hypothetical protein